MKDEVQASLQTPTDLLSDILKRFTLEDEKFQTFTACDDNEIEMFWEIIQQIDGSLTPEDTTKKAIEDKAELQKFLSYLCQIRYYTWKYDRGKEDW